MRSSELTLIALAGLAAAASASAGALPSIAFLGMGFSEVHLSDLADSPFYNLRASVPSAFLSATADFNGDGRPDEARILQHPERQVGYVIVVIQTAKLDTYVLKTFPLSDLPHLGIDALGPAPGVKVGNGRPGLVIFV